MTRGERLYFLFSPVATLIFGLVVGYFMGSFAQ